MPKIYLLVILFIVFIALSNGFSPHKQIISSSKMNLSSINASNQYTTSTDKINPDNPQIKKYFQKVAEVPYKADYNSNVPKTPVQFWRDNCGDCDDKSTAFADYLYKLGADDVQLVTIIHDSNRYAHCVVMWQNRIFDATAEPPVYNMNRNKYYNYIKNLGFKLWIAHPYSPSKESLQKESLILNL